MSMNDVLQQSLRDEYSEETRNASSRQPPADRKASPATLL